MRSSLEKMLRSLRKADYQFETGKTNAIINIDPDDYRVLKIGLKMLQKELDKIDEANRPVCGINGVVCSFCQPICGSRIEKDGVL